MTLRLFLLFTYLVASNVRLRSFVRYHHRLEQGNIETRGGNPREPRAMFSAGFLSRNINRRAQAVLKAKSTSRSVCSAKTCGKCSKLMSSGFKSASEPVLKYCQILVKSSTCCPREFILNVGF